MLDMELFSMIRESLGPLQVDLFATRFSTRLPRFFSWRPDPEAEATDAFLQDWSGIMGYAIPPWCLIARVLCKAQSQGVSLVINRGAILANSDMVSPVGINVSGLSNPATIRPRNVKSISELRRDNVPGSTGHLQGLRSRFRAEGISEQAIKLIFASWREKTGANYDSAWELGVPPRIYKSLCGRCFTHPRIPGIGIIMRMARNIGR